MGNESSKTKHNPQLRKLVLDQLSKLPMREQVFIKACCRAEVAQIQNAIENNVNPNVPDLTFCSPLHFVICSQENPNPAEVVKLLLRYEIYPLSTAKNGASAVHTVVVSQENNDLAIELMQALIYDNFSSKQLIMVDMDGNTPLHLAAQLGRTAIVVELLKKAEEYDCAALCLEKTNVREETALHVTQSPTVAQILLTYSPNIVNLQDIQGRTALHFAVTKKNLELTKILLDCNALPDIKDRSNFSPLSLVQLPSHKKQLDFLLENNLLLALSRQQAQRDREENMRSFVQQQQTPDKPGVDEQVQMLTEEVEALKIQHEQAMTLLRLEYDERFRQLSEEISLQSSQPRESDKMG